MSNYIYPYIPPEYYQATMYACRLIRKYRNYNKAVKAASNKYCVDGNEVAKHVSARAAAGKRAKSKKRATNARRY